MASGGIQSCDICSLRNIATAAVEWCPECDEYLCDKCKEHHALAKSTRKHCNVLLRNMQKLPSFVKNMQMSCSEHEERYLYFCDDHDSPCCVECFKLDHANCRNLSPIQKVVEDCKFSTSFLDLEKTVSDLLENYENIIKDRKDYLKLLEKQQKSLLHTVKSTRESFDSYLNKLEAELTETIELSIGARSQITRSLLEDVVRRKEKVANFQENIAVVKNDATDFQSFMAMRHLSESILTEESALQQIFEENLLEWIEFVVTPTNVQRISDYFSSLGNINSVTNPCKIKKVNGKGKQAQFFGSSLSNRNDVKDIKMRKKSCFRVTVPKSDKIEILDCLLLPNGKQVFLDKPNKRLIVIGTDNKFEKEIVLIFQPMRFSVLNTFLLAITTAFAKKIIIVNVESGHVTKTIDTEIVCCSIFKSSTFFIVENFQLGYAVLDFSGKHFYNIPIESTGSVSPRDVTQIGDNLYYVDPNQIKVHCCDLKGKQMWEFQSRRLKCPYPITSDNSSVIFVVGFHSKNVFAISLDGKEFSEVVCSSPLLHSAVAVFYCASSTRLQVITQEGICSIYEI